MMNRVAVVGGGAVGVTAAGDLADDGADVTLYERGDPASGASGRAAGIVYDAFAEDRDAAVAARALDRFRSLDAAGRLSMTPHPYVWLARAGDESAADAIRTQVPRMRAHGRDVELLDADGLGDRFPALETGDVAVAALARDAAYLDPESTVLAMAGRARDASATIRTGVEASLAGDGTAIRTDAGTESYDAVLVAAGANSARLLADAGFSIAMKPYRVQALVTDPMDVVDPSAADAAPAVPTTYDATGSYYFRPCEGGLLVGDGTEEREFDPDEYDETADDTFLEDSRRRVGERLRVDADDVTVRRAWAGLCTATPDRNPLLGPVDADERVFVATGWHGHGFMRAPALAETVAAQIRSGDGIEAFDPRRFDGDESFQVVEGMTIED